MPSGQSIYVGNQNRMRIVDTEVERSLIVGNYKEEVRIRQLVAEGRSATNKA